MFQLSPDAKDNKQKWSDKKLDCQHGGVVLVDGYIYGASSPGKWICLDFNTGKIIYEEKGVGKGSVIYADGMLSCFGENGTVALVKASPDAYKIAGSFKIKQGSNEHWAHPAISNGKLFIRHGDALMAYNIKENKGN